MANSNPPILSPRFQFNMETFALEYKPYPRYPSWLTAWELLDFATLIIGGVGSLFGQQRHYVLLDGIHLYGSSGIFYNTNQAHGFICQTANQNSVVEFPLQWNGAEGVDYAVKILGVKQPTGGVVSITLNGYDLSGGGFDTYDANTVYNEEWTSFIPADTMPNTTLQFHMVTTDKNPSSAGYDIGMTRIAIFPQP